MRIAPKRTVVPIGIVLFLFLGLSPTAAGDLAWSTFLGGSNDDWGYGIAVSGDKTFVFGETLSNNFPATTGTYDVSYNGTGPWGGGDLFVASFNQAGSALHYATYLGGSGDDYGEGIAVDASGNAYLTGFTNSIDFPTTPGAYDAQFHGVYVTKINAAGDALVYSTYLGGSSSDGGYGIAVNSKGSAFVTGFTYSHDFPVTAGCYDDSFNDVSQFTGDVFVTKFNPAGTGLEYSTFLGGTDGEWGESIAVDGASRAYVTGSTGSSAFPTTAYAYDRTHGGERDVFVTKINTTGTAVEYSTFLGGISFDDGQGIAVDGAGNAFIAGTTYSFNFPTTTGAFDRAFGGVRDAFVVKLNDAGNGLDYGTFLGGSGDDLGNGLTIDGSGHAYVTGWTQSADFPTTDGAYDAALSGTGDAYVTRLNKPGSGLVYSTFLGGGDDDEGFGIAVDNSGDAYVAGWTESTGFPTTAGAYDTGHNGLGDAFVAKLNLAGTPVGSQDPLADVPERFVLHQNYPNPFNARTEIRYQIGEDEHVRIKVYNIQGAEVVTLIDADQAAGSYELRWDAKEMASGIYFCRLQAGEYVETVKMVLLR